MPAFRALLSYPRLPTLMVRAERRGSVLHHECTSSCTEHMRNARFLNTDMKAESSPGSVSASKFLVLIVNDIISSWDACSSTVRCLRTILLLLIGRALRQCHSMVAAALAAVVKVLNRYIITSFSDGAELP